jgi:hypothetical protein
MLVLKDFVIIAIIMFGGVIVNKIVDLWVRKLDNSASTRVLGETRPLLEKAAAKEGILSEEEKTLLGSLFVEAKAVEGFRNEITSATGEMLITLKKIDSNL